MELDPHIPEPLQRQSSTKQLICQYESMNNPTTINSKFKACSLSQTALVSPGPLVSLAWKKEKSPIHQSFRNLFSVFKKATRSGIGKNNNSITLTPLAPPDISSSRPQTFSGTLLYLSRPVQPLPMLPSPAWIPCVAILHGNNITIHSTGSDEASFEHTISLSHFSDIRSLPLHLLDQSEKTLLRQRNNAQEPKVFEILFEGRAREKFAAASVQERAGWVSAIWDAVLPTQEPRMIDPIGKPITKLTEVDCQSSNETPTANYSHLTLPSPRNSLSASHAERSLPPLPANSILDGQPLRTQRTEIQGQPQPFSPLSPSIYPSNRPSIISCASSRETNSPSIVNLGRLSMVQQRLNQIERNNSQQSSSYDFKSSTPSRKSQDTHLTTPSLGKLNNPYDMLESRRMEIMKSGSSVKFTLDYDQDTGASPLSLDTPEEPESPGPSENLVAPHPEPFATLLRDHASKNHEQTMNLGDQITSLQDEVQRLPHELASVVSGGLNNAVIQKIVSDLETGTGTNTKMLESISKDILVAEKHWAGIATLPTQFVDIRQVLGLIQQQLDKDVLLILKKLDQIHDSEKGGRDTKDPQSPRTYNNLGPHPIDSATFSATVDLSVLEGKLDSLALNSVCRPLGDDLKIQFTEIRELLEELKNDTVLQGKQQIESLRYLNELNIWLEAFVNNGSSQARNLAANVDKLSRYVGCSSELPEATGGPVLLETIHEYFLKHHTKDTGLDILRSTMDSLLTVMSDDSRKAPNMEYITNMIDRQRLEQEILVKSLATEISDQIKGERLRFVEAMKEATAINVQIHVEQFKKELSREVMEMTEQVGRLHRERQAMETQIADLFTFYSKQKDSVGAQYVTADMVYTDPLDQRSGNTSHRRPLPQPLRL